MTQIRLVLRSSPFAALLLSGLLLNISGAQNSSASPSPAPSASPGQATRNEPNDPDRYLREGLKAIADESRTLVGWGLALIGASVIAIASTSYFRPLNLKVRLIYLLFIPGWFFIGLSARNGESVSRRFAAAGFAQDRGTLLQIGNFINEEFGNQLTYLQWGVGFFSLWLFMFILWWIFGNVPKPED